MDSCKGIGDWLGCLKCPQLCKRECPLESDNVIEEIGKQIRNSSLRGETGERSRVKGTRNS